MLKNVNANRLILVGLVTLVLIPFSNCDSGFQGVSDSSSKQSSGPDSDPDVTPQPEPEPTPTPNPTPTPSPTPTPNPTPTPSPTLTPSPTPTANPTPTPDPNPDMGDSGNAITASSCSLSDVKAAIDQARDGDVVIVPSGSCTWASGLSISGKGIHLKAASPGAVTLKHGGGAFSMFNITSDSTHSVRVSGFNFNDTSSTEYWNGTFVHALGSGKPILLHDNVISSPYRRVIAWRARGGVIYNNLFEGFGGTVNAIQILGESDSWSTPDTMGMRDVNGDRNLYIEDNTFKNYIAQSLDPDSHSRVVIRYNLFDHSALSSHGADTSTHGTRHWEFYNNQFIWKNHGDCDGSKTVNLAYLWYIRGGTGIIADNVFVDLNSCAWGNKPEIVFTVQNINRRAGPYACWTTYPAPHQVGQSHDGSKYITDPVYIWGNMGGGNYNNPSVSTYSPDDCGNGLKSTDFIKPNRDYITGQAKPGYSKYPYPHPLR